jgi:hypothetical protein
MLVPKGAWSPKKTTEADDEDAYAYGYACVGVYFL